MHPSHRAEHFVALWRASGSRRSGNCKERRIDTPINPTPRPLIADRIAGSLASSRSNIGIGPNIMQRWRRVRMRRMHDCIEQFTVWPVEALRSRRRTWVRPRMRTVAQTARDEGRAEAGRPIASRRMSRKDRSVLSARLSER